MGPTIINSLCIRYFYHKPFYPKMETYVRQACLQCNSQIDEATFHRSMKKYKFPLCEDCQIWFVGRIFHATPETIQLYFALKGRGIAAQLEKPDQYKRADIAISGSNLHIEVNGSHQNYNATEALRELKKYLNDFNQESITLKIPGSLVKFNIEQTSDIILKIVMENRSGASGLAKS